MNVENGGLEELLTGEISGAGCFSEEGEIGDGELLREAG